MHRRCFLHLRFSDTAATQLQAAWSLQRASWLPTVSCTLIITCHSVLYSKARVEFSQRNLDTAKAALDCGGRGQDADNEQYGHQIVD